jgi:multidrug efflux pump subunit AcrB
MRQGLRAARRHRFAFNPPAIQGLGQAGGFEVYVQGRRRRPAAPRAGHAAVHRRGAARTRSSTGINTFFRPTVPQLRVEVDREKALALGVPVPTCSRRCRHRWGRSTSTTSTSSGRTYRVHDAGRRAVPRQARGPRRVYVRSARRGEMIPLKALITRREHHRPRADRALQRLHRRQGARQRQARLLLGRGDRRGRAGRARALPPEGYSDRVDGPGLPGEAHRQRVDLRLRLRAS